MKFEGRGFEELSEETILNRISEYDIFSYYIPEFKAINRNFNSPFRKDSNPSCCIQQWNGKLFYKDFGTGESYTCINFIRAKYNVTYYEALRIISNDFNLGLHGNSVKPSTMGFIGIPHQVIKKDEKSSIIKIKRRQWNTGLDKEYWCDEHGFNIAVLTHFNVHPISHLWVGNTYLERKSNNPSYAYIINEGKYKILSPYDTNYKWLTNCTSKDIQGYNQLPSAGELLIITSSYKDCMKLYQYGYYAIAPGSENTGIDIELMSELKERFKRIIVFFDNDEPGIEAAKTYEALYNVDYVHLPLQDPKDISDYYKKWGDVPTGQILKQLFI